MNEKNNLVPAVCLNGHPINLWGNPLVVKRGTQSVQLWGNPLVCHCGAATKASA